MTLFLSRLILARDPSRAALGALIDPDDPARAMDAHHRLLWTVFTDGPNRQRDFLWRAAGRGRFLTLSERPPEASGAGLFEPPEVKPFAPELREGDRLSFVLRANATRTRRIGPAGPDGRPRRAHVDVVMDALHGLPSGRKSEARCEARAAVAQEQGAAWLTAQGEQHGFAAEEVMVADYSVVALPSHVGPRQGQPQFGVLELTGRLRVTDSQALIARLGHGFGRAKAFGCGLMLIRRAA